MWNKLKSFFSIKYSEPRYVIVKWKLGDRWAIKDKKTGKFKSLTSPGSWWHENDTYFNSCCTSSDKADVEEWCEYLNNNGTLWEEVE